MVVGLLRVLLVGASLVSGVVAALQAAVAHADGADSRDSMGLSRSDDRSGDRFARLGSA